MEDAENTWNKKEFIGISSGNWPTKPITGSTFKLLDTGEEYIFHNGMWEMTIPMPGMEI